MVFTAGIFNASIKRAKQIILKFEAGRTSFQTIKEVGGTISIKIKRALKTLRTFDNNPQYAIIISIRTLLHCLCVATQRQQISWRLQDREERTSD